MHLQDNTGDNLKDRSLAEDDIHMPPGHGLIPWKEFFTKLKEFEYDGGLIFELKADSVAGKEMRYVLQEAVKFINSGVFPVPV